MSKWDEVRSEEELAEARKLLDAFDDELLDQLITSQRNVLDAIIAADEPAYLNAEKRSCELGLRLANSVTKVLSEVRLHGNRSDSLVKTMSSLTKMPHDRDKVQVIQAIRLQTADGLRESLPDWNLIVSSIISQTMAVRSKQFILNAPDPLDDEQLGRLRTYTDLTQAKHRILLLGYTHNHWDRHRSSGSSGNTDLHSYRWIQSLIQFKDSPIAKEAPKTAIDAASRPPYESGRDLPVSAETYRGLEDLQRDPLVTQAIAENMRSLHDLPSLCFAALSSRGARSYAEGMSSEEDPLVNEVIGRHIELHVDPGHLGAERLAGKQRSLVAVLAGGELANLHSIPHKDETTPIQTAEPDEEVPAPRPKLRTKIQNARYLAGFWFPQFSKPVADAALAEKSRLTKINAFFIASVAIAALNPIGASIVFGLFAGQVSGWLVAAAVAGLLVVGELVDVGLSALEDRQWLKLMDSVKRNVSRFYRRGLFSLEGKQLSQLQDGEVSMLDNPHMKVIGQAFAAAGSRVSQGLSRYVGSAIALCALAPFAVIPVAVISELQRRIVMKLLDKFKETVDLQAAMDAEYANVSSDRMTAKGIRTAQLWGLTEQVDKHLDELWEPGHGVNLRTWNWQRAMLVVTGIGAVVASIGAIVGIGLATGMPLAATAAAAACTSRVMVNMRQFINDQNLKEEGVVASRQLTKMIANERGRERGLERSQLTGEQPRAVREVGQSQEPVAIRFASVRTQRDNGLSSRMSLTVYPGEHVAVIGQTGAGKSTAGRVLIGFQDYLRGSVQLRKGTGRWQSQTDFSFQELRNIIRTVNRETQLIVPEMLQGLDPTAVRNAFKEVNLPSRVIDNVFKGKTRELSDGERQRALFVLSSMRGNPQVYFLDEPEAGLDAEHARLLVPYLFKSGKTVLVATHSPVIASAPSVSRVIVLDGSGAIVQQGKPEEVFRGTGNTPGSRWWLNATGAPHESASRVLAGTQRVGDYSSGRAAFESATPGAAFHF